jgi:hypothetical protein
MPTPGSMSVATVDRIYDVPFSVATALEISGIVNGNL